jgi:hypothetical protein
LLRADAAAGAAGPEGAAEPEVAAADVEGGAFSGVRACEIWCSWMVVRRPGGRGRSNLGPRRAQSQTNRFV